MSIEQAATERLELALLQALSTCGGGALTLAEAADRCAETLGSSPRALPFAAVYLLEDGGLRARRAASSAGGPALPDSVKVTAGDAWGFAAALERAEPVRIRLADALPAQPREPGRAPFETAAVLALVEPHGARRLGVLVAGLDPRRELDGGQRAWLRLVAAGVAGALAHGRARESERRQAAALEESERRFAWFMNHLPGLAWIKDSDGRYLFVNDAAALAFGRARGDILEHTDADIFPPDTAAQFRGNDARVLAGEGALQTVETLEHEDGVHHSLVSKFAIPARPGASLIGGIAIDVTQRIRFEAALQESEARFRSLADHAPVLIWINGLEGCEFVNREYLRFLGCPWEQVEGLGWQRYLHPDDRDDYVAAYLRAFEARQPFDAQARLRRADGQYRWLHSTGVPRVTADRVFVGYVGCSHDITELKRSEYALLEADRHKDEFLATLAHELRNPLAPMRNALETMRLVGAADAEALAQARGIIERQLRQMVRLIDDLLDLGRISRGKLELRKQRLTLAALLEATLETMKPTLDASGRKLEVTAPDQPVELEGDLTRLAQVFANLLDNAVKYTDAGGHIRLSARRHGASIVVSVADDGIGISPDALARVFDMFTQVDRACGPSRGGLGVGLSIVRNLVALHGGSVEALSDGRGRGAEFVVRLPALEAPARPTAPAVAQSPVRAAPKRILVVDDNEDSAASLALLLQIKGNEVRTAQDGSEALGLAEAFRPHMIFLDIGLPGLDGHGVCRRIREQPWGHELPIVALTGWSREEDRRRSQQSGFTHHLVKPAEPALVDRLLAGLPVLPPMR